MAKKTILTGGVRRGHNPHVSSYRAGVRWSCSTIAKRRATTDSEADLTDIMELVRDRGAAPKNATGKAARAFRHASEEDLKRLQDAMGWPPDVDNIPQSLIDDVIRNIEKAAASAMLLLFLSSADGMRQRVGADVSAAAIGKRARDYAEQRAAETSRSVVDTTLTRFANSQDAINRAAERAAADGITGRAAQQRYVMERIDRESPAGRVLSGGVTAGDRIQQIIVHEAGTARKRAEVAYTEEYSRENPENAVLRIWRHPRAKTGKHPCPKICRPLLGRPAPYWPVIHPGLPDVWDGPPGHINCLAPDPDQLLVFPGKRSHRFKASYDGWCMELRLASGRNLSVTPNHPVLTVKGWQPAHAIGEGDYVVSSPDPERVAFLVTPDADHGPSSAEQEFRAAVEPLPMRSCRVPASAHDFHGDGRFFNGEVDVKWSGGLLGRRPKTTTEKPAGQVALQRRRIRAVDFPSLGGLHLFMQRHGFPTGSAVSRRILPLALLLRSILPYQLLGVGPAADVHAVGQQPFLERIARIAGLIGKLQERHSANIQPLEVVKVRRFRHRGHVYDFSVEGQGWYFANGTIIHNCDCEATERIVTKDEAERIALSATAF